METETEVLNRDGLVITLTRGEPAATLTWRGTSDVRDPSRFLMPVLTRLAADLAGGSLTLDFRAFEYMNSATVSSLIHFLRELDARKVRTAVLYNAEAAWQRLSFQSLEAVARSLPHIGIQRA